MKLKEWGAFTYLCLVWGSSFLLIKIALEDITPLTLVACRLGLASIGLWGILLFSKSNPPEQPRYHFYMIGVGLFNTAIPFVLITWGEQYVASGVASILNSTTPLFTLIFAHFALADERITLPRLVGLLLGFAGVVLIFSRGLDLTTMAANTNILLGQGAVVLAALCYGIGVVFTRRYLGGINPIVVATVTVTSGFVGTLLALIILESSISLSMSVRTLGALLVLGVMGVTLAQVFFYYLIRQWGATRSSLVTYVIPVAGVTLGYLILDEPVDWRLFVGFAAILAGIVIVNRWKTAQPHTT